MKQRFRIFCLPALISSCLLCLCLVSGLQAWAGESNGITEEEIKFYAFMSEENPDPIGPLYKFLEARGLAKGILIPQPLSDSKFRPLAPWRRWVEKPQAFSPSLAFCLLVSWIFWTLLPKKLENVEQICRREFWKSFFTGMAVAAICLTLARSVFFTHLGWPLGIVLIAVFQLGMLLGLSVIVSMMGHSLALLLRLPKVPFLAQKPGLCKFIDLAIGALLCASLLQIPLIGDLPRLGTRLISLFCVLGLGGLFKVLRQTNASSDN